MTHVIVFDIWGEYGHFRKHYTTTSPLTFSIPTRTALTGLIGAILGCPKEEYLNHFGRDKAHIGVKLIKPVKKITFSENLIDTKKAGPMMNEIKNRTQIQFEFLRNPHFRIYFAHADPVLQRKARDQISAHCSVYTPYLGLSEHIADFAYIGEFEAGQKESGDAEIHTAIRNDDIGKLIFEPGRQYITEIMPTEMAPDRTVTNYSDVIFERNGNPIRVAGTHYWELENGECITFL
ncbi:type I-B CRISPR-associated protein Cas5 [Methanosalsum natronophilum]|uniref:Type I-B CRISPR-associated protein Cas5 n=1 Tax=Methanosalsum natronophilum TaxID=768733 RepID=A0A424Z4X5_9EURY|nr:MAG: type I-B CRISPR-associated protein Cas5 [Methanosalsum natronophilum]